VKTIQGTITVLVIGVVFISCEGPKDFSVTVVDKQTRQPVESVFVQVKVKAGKIDKSAYNLQGFTDSSGKFERTEMIGYGLSLRRWDFYMDYDKTGYVHKMECNHTEGIVEMEH
jgi:hypothetical protein